MRTSPPNPESMLPRQISVSRLGILGARGSSWLGQQPLRDGESDRSQRRWRCLETPKRPPASLQVSYPPSSSTDPPCSSPSLETGREDLEGAACAQPTVPHHSFHTTPHPFLLQLEPPLATRACGLHASHDDAHASIQVSCLRLSACCSSARVRSVASVASIHSQFHNPCSLPPLLAIHTHSPHTHNTLS